MQSTSPISPFDLTRQERLAVFMKREGLTYKALGARIGVSTTTASALLNGETIPPYRHEQLRAFIPIELMPPAVYIKPGPKPDPSPNAGWASAV